MAPPWCEDEGLLSSLFALQHLPFASQQGTRNAERCVDLWLRFLQCLRRRREEKKGADPPGQQLWPDLTDEDLASLEAACGLAASGAIWQPEYGCAVLALPAGEPDTQPVPGTLAVVVVGLDNWEHDSHSTSDGGIQHVGVCKGSQLLHCGQLHAAQLDAFRAQLATVMAKVAERKGDARAQVAGRQGHQKTPAMVRAAAVQALRQLAAEAAAEAEGREADSVPDQVPQGGFTDVGMHTGGGQRDTAWPVVREVLKALLAHAAPCRSANPDLFQLAEAHLFLWVMQRQVAALTPEAATSTVLNAAMRMLQAVAQRAAELAQQGHAVAHFEASCAAARRALEAARAARVQAAAAAARLPSGPAAAAACGPGSHRLPRGALPELPPPLADEGGLEAARKRQANNLGSLPLPDSAAGQLALTNLLAVLRSSELRGNQSSDLVAQHALSLVERELYARAAGGFAAEASLSQAEVDALVEVVMEYFAVLHRFQASDCAAARMRVELRSRGLLVCWVALCAVHAAAALQHPMLLKYGVAVDWKDLKHLVLSDRPAVDAALAVASYLRRHAQPGRPAFSLADGGMATFDLARQFALADARLLQMWEEEAAAAAQRRDAHWAEIRRKQEEVARLRAQLKAQKRTRDSELSDVSDAQDEYDSTLHSSYERRQAALRRLEEAQRRLASAQQDVASTKSLLSLNLKPPSPVIQPLPEHHGAAAPWLFFLHMPPVIRQLARLSFLAQQLLLPVTDAVLSAIQVNSSKTSLCDHYNSCQKSNWLADTGRRGTNGEPALVQLWSDGEVPRADQVRLPTVDNYSASSHGVWHPDNLPLRMAWAGSGSAAADGKLGGLGWFNPWAQLPGSAVVDSFTKQLAGEAAALQWAMPVYGGGAATAPERGNLPIARQDQRPPWLSKPAFLALGSLRAYARVQGRQLCAALAGRVLPLGHPAVQCLCRQLLYHVGELTEGSSGALELLWRSDWSSGSEVGDGGVLGALHAELAGLADELANAPREHDAVLFLGELAAYLSDWHPPLRDVARSFAAAAAGWADELEAEAQQLPPDQARPTRAKQCQLRATALLCHAAGPLSTADVQSLLSLAVQVHNGAIYGSGTPLEGPLQRLQVLCHWTLARRADAVMAAAKRDPNLLTTALRVIIRHAPDNLPWRRQVFTASEAHTASFAALGSDGSLYAINLLDGTVLQDGAPPGRLPREIREHRLYKRIFGAWGFEVTTSQTGVRRTVGPVAGRNYEFWLAGKDSSQLVVIEETVLPGLEGNGASRKRRMQLLDVGKDCSGGGWGAELPVRLLELHSHWLDREGVAIVLRPHHFRERRTAFVIRTRPARQAGQGAAGTADAAVDLDCRRVPQHLAERSGCDSDDFEQLLAQHGSQLTDQLVLHESAVTAVLSKFEQRRFIHCYVPHGAGDGSGSGGSAGQGSAEQADAAANGFQPGRRLMLFELPRFRLEFELLVGAGEAQAKEPLPGDEQPQNTELRSLDYAGYCLAPCQQLWEPAAAGGKDGGFRAASYTLPDLEQYLVLHPALQQGSGTVAAPQRRLVIVPVGRAVRLEAAVEIEHSSDSDADVKSHTYSIHPRFGHLVAPSHSPHARLQLAALYAATSSLLPEPQSRLTGVQVAMQLLRQCWGVRPLLPEESQLILDATRLGGHLAAGLRLLAHELLCSAAQLNGLHFPPPLEPLEHCLPPELDPEWAAAYQKERQGLGALNPRLQLAPAEELRAQGHYSVPPAPPLWRRLALHRPIEVPACPVAADAVSATEARLSELVVMSDGQATVPAYPLPVGSVEDRKNKKSKKEKKRNAGCGDGPAGHAGPARATPLERQMHAELEDSWHTHHSTPAPVSVKPGAADTIHAAVQLITSLRQQAEEYLNTHLGTVPAAVGWPGLCFRMQRAAGLAPEHGSLDLLRLALPGGRQLAAQLNPFLSAASAERVQQGARVWLQDRLGRLALLVSDDTAQLQLLQELTVHRTWSVDKHPLWLAFEAEQQLQVRPQQAWVAQHLMAHPGDIVQLNMGEGKTRVILPLLILHWADGNNLVRLNLLPTLLEEAGAHLHSCLCASALGRRIFVQPFHRDVVVTPALLAAMHSSLQLCRQEGGVLLTTPERRLSLRLKRQELWQQGKKELWAALGAIEEGLPYIDLLDESDELLTHRYQLIYAWGAPTELPAQQARARACQALLRILSAEGRRGALGETLAREGVAKPAGPDGAPPGAFRGFRLLPGIALEAAAPALRRQLAEGLLAGPPYALRWMRVYPDQNLLLRCMTDADLDANEELAGASTALGEDAVADVLALRGLLACGVLEHCLSLRYLVDYGLIDGPKPRTKLAVPYRTARSPSERSVWAQPDTNLTFTTMSYYNRGLSPDELLQAVHALLKLGGNAQVQHYQHQWLPLAAADVPAADLEPVDSVNKLDPTNTAQLELLHRLFSHNMAAVDFYLNSIVFPAELRQFPSRLVATSWDLADTPGGRVVGFSGTNDNHRLLPLQVRQQLQVEPVLHATNGRMLAILLDNPQYDTLAVPEDEPVWQALLRLAVARGVDAVLDCGAQLAGTSNSSAASFLLPLLDRSRFRGVCFFDEGQRQWAVLDLQGRCLPRDCSPIREAQALTLFDEARCRGADLQLRADAVGLLTLGPATCKDKLMQAAGRMRKLGKGQTLRTVGTADITARIARASGLAPAAAAAGGLTSRHVLAFVMANTVATTQKGVLEWGHQGLQFAAARGAPEHALQPEVLTLEAMYGSARTLCGVPEVLGQQHRRRQAERGNLPDDMAQLMADVAQRGGGYGAGLEVVAQGGLGEECERELERQEEEEEEVEKEVARVAPLAEASWDYAAALHAGSVEALERAIGKRLLPLSSLAAHLVPQAVSGLAWSPLVFATPNFAHATEQAPGAALNEYLRPVGDMLLLADAPGEYDSHADAKPAAGGAVVLLSEREANGFLEALWPGGSRTTGNVRSKAGSYRAAAMLVSMPYACAVQPTGTAAAQARPAGPLQLAACVSSEVARQLAAQLSAGQFRAQLASLRLFNGDATFVPPWQLAGVDEDAWWQLPSLATLRALVAGQRAAAEALVAMRGKQVLFAYSQLELACDAEQPGAAA